MLSGALNVIVIVEAETKEEFSKRDERKKTLREGDL